ncbi:MAG: Holliday junction resolvase RuvX [Pseudomonadota bacterium]
MTPFTPLEDLKPHGPLMGLDYGTKTIGLAVSDSDRRIASPLHTIRRTKFTKDIKELFDLADRYGVVAFVLGLPLNMDGSSGPRVQATRDFAKNLARHDPRPIAAWDERWSTVAAERAMIAADASRATRRAAIDKVAAAIILEGALGFLANRAG